MTFGIQRKNTNSNNNNNNNVLGDPVATSDIISTTIVDTSDIPPADGEESGIIVNVTGLAQVDDPDDVTDVEGDAYILAGTSEITGVVNTLDNYSAPIDEPNIPTITDNQENSAIVAPTFLTSTVTNSAISSVSFSSNASTVLNAASTSINSALNTAVASSVINISSQNNPNFIPAIPPNSNTATSNYTLTSGNDGMTAAVLEQTVDSLTSSTTLQNAINNYTNNTSDSSPSSVFPDVPGASVNNLQETQSPPEGTGPQQGSSSKSGGEETTKTTFDYNGTSYETLDDAKTAIAAQFGFFDIQNNYGRPNVDASEKVPSDQVTPYSGRIRNLNLDRPEIISLTEFRPLYTIDPDGSSNVKNNTGVLSQYDIVNSGLTKTSAGRLFSLQAHLRIVLQDTVNSVFSGLVSYNISSLMKKISHAQENKKIFNDIPYSPPFPKTFTNKFVIDYIKLKDENLGKELLDIGEEKYLNLIFQFFLNSVFADKIFSNRTQSLPSISNSEPIVVEEIQTTVIEDSIVATDYTETTYETIVVLPSDISTLERAANVSQNVSTILTDIFGVVDNYSFLPKIADLDQFNEKASSYFKAEKGTSNSFYDGKDSNSRSPDLIQIHRILHNALISFCGIPTENAGLSKNISFPDIDGDLADLLKDPKKLSLASLVDNIANLPFAEFGEFEEKLVGGLRYTGDIISVKNDFNDSSAKNLFKDIILPLISEDVGLENSLIAMSAFVADLKFAINENKMFSNSNMTNPDVSSYTDMFDYYHKLSRLFTYIPNLPQQPGYNDPSNIYIDSLVNKNSEINSISSEKYAIGEIGASNQVITNPFASGYSSYVGGQEPTSEPTSTYGNKQTGLGANTNGSGGGVGSLDSGNSLIYTSVPSEYGTSYIGVSSNAIADSEGIPSALGRLYYVKNNNAFYVGSMIKSGQVNPNPTEDNSAFKLNGLAAYTFDGFPEDLNQNFYATLGEISKDGYENQYGFVGYASTQLKNSTANVIKDFNDRFELDINQDTGYRYLEHMFETLGNVFDPDENNFNFVKLLAIYMFSVAADKGEAAKSQLLAGILGRHVVETASDTNNSSSEDYGYHQYEPKISDIVLRSKALGIYDAPQSTTNENGDKQYLSNIHHYIGPDAEVKVPQSFIRSIIKSITQTLIYTGTESISGDIISADTLSGDINTTVEQQYYRHLKFNKSGDTNNVGGGNSNNAFQIFSTLLDHFSRKFYSSLPRFDGLSRHNLYTTFFLESDTSERPLSYESKNLDKFFKKVGPEEQADAKTYCKDELNLIIKTTNSEESAAMSTSLQTSATSTGTRDVELYQALDMIGYADFSKEFNEIPDSQRAEHVIDLKLGNLDDLGDTSGNDTAGVSYLGIKEYLGNAIEIISAATLIKNNTGEVESKSIASLFETYSGLLKNNVDTNIIGWLVSYEKSFIESEIAAGRMTKEDYMASVSGHMLESYSHTGINGSRIKRIISTFNILCHIAQNIFPTIMEIGETYHSSLSFNSNELEKNNANIYYNPEIGKGMADAFKGIKNAYLDKNRRMEHLNMLGADANNLDKFVNYQFGYHQAEKIRTRMFSIYNDSKKTGIKLLEKIGKIGGIYDFILAGSANEYNEVTNNWTETNVIQGSTSSEVINSHEIPRPRNPDVFDDLIGLQTPVQLDNYSIMKRKLLRQSVSNFYLPASKAISPQQIKNTLRFLSSDNRGYKIDKSFAGQRGGKIIMHVGVPAQFLDSSSAGVTGANSTYAGYVAILIKRVDLSTGKTQAYKKSYVYSPALYFVDNCEVPDEVISKATMEDTSDSDGFFEFINKHKLKSVYSGEFNDIVYENVTNTGNQSLDTLVKNTILNHIEDYYLKIYNRIMTGIDLDEDVFQLSDDDGVTISPGADLEPLLGKSDYQYAFKTILEAKLLNSGLSSEQKTSIANEIGRIKSEAERSVFFSPFKYLYRVIRTRVFDRTFSMFIDESNENFIDIEDANYTRPAGFGDASFNYEVVNTSGGEDTDGKVGKLYSYFVEFETF